MLNELIKDFLFNPEAFFGISSFYLLLLTLPIALFSAVNKTSNSLVRYLTALANLLLTFQLLSRWLLSGHFPISNLYESLCFLTWALTLGQLLLEREYQSPIIPAVLNPVILLSLGFACFVLPDDLRLSSSLVPALRSTWLVMHVSVVMLSYAALIIGSLISASVLFVNTNQSLQIRSNSSGVGSYRTGSANYLEPTDFTDSERLDTLSYRSILIGFVLLTLGLISGAVWANEAWGTWWSWDPKETWALISWLFYATYLHMRISKGWQGRKPAILASTGFLVVLICYIGVNFLGIGLHSYGWIF